MTEWPDDDVPIFDGQTATALFLWAFLVAVLIGLVWTVGRADDAARQHRHIEMRIESETPPDVTPASADGQ